MGYLSRDSEFEVMFDNSVRLSIDDIEPVVDTTVVNNMIRYASGLEVSPEVGYYIVDLVHATREDPAVAIGGSPRAAINLLKAGRVMAASDGREHVYPDDIRAVLVPVLAHRIILNPDAILRGETVEGVIERVSGQVKAPMMAKGRTLEAVGAGE
jgi:MoxR-like ATPase